jgi:hypothetical protein
VTGYWPFWVGAPALALVTVGACIVGRRPLGVSGILSRFVDLPGELRAERRRTAMASTDDRALEAALLAATLEAFGPLPLAGPAPGDAPAAGAPGLPEAAEPAAGRACAGRCGEAVARPTLGAHAVFLVAMVAGAFLVQLGRGGWHLSFSLGEAFERVVASGPAGLAALLGGGLLVGAGTAISGGCSTGHGLSGCSRLQPAGVAATVTFFGVAALVSRLLAGRPW